MKNFELSQRNSDVNLLAPFLQKRLALALSECAANNLDVHVFETYRSRERQDFLYASGRTREGKKITYAKGGESYHNFGLAVDLAFKKDGKWAWNADDPWDKVHEIFKKHGFETLKFEKAHVQISCGISVDKCNSVSKERGLLALWSIIESVL